MILAWDFDGVLVDTLHECHQSYNGALKELGLPGLTAEQFSFERKTAVQATDFFAQYFVRKSGDMHHTPEKTEKSFDQHRDAVLKLQEAYHRHRDAHLEADFDNNPVYPGVMDALHQLKDRGQKMAVVSARDDASLKKYLQAKELDGYFDKVVGSSAFFAKSHQLKPLQVDSLKEKDIFFVDDMPAVLFSLQKHARLFYAAWGYGKLDEYLEYRRRGGNPEDITTPKGVVWPYKSADLQDRETEGGKIPPAVPTVLKKPADILSYVKSLDEKPNEVVPSK